jgi:hypothetical protein
MEGSRVLEHGTWISIGFLTLLGVANLIAVVCTPRGEIVRAVAYAVTSSRASRAPSIPC